MMLRDCSRGGETPSDHVGQFTWTRSTSFSGNDSLWWSDIARHVLNSANAKSCTIPIKQTPLMVYIKSELISINFFEFIGRNTLRVLALSIKRPIHWIINISSFFPSIYLYQHNWKITEFHVLLLFLLYFLISCSLSVSFFYCDETLNATELRSGRRFIFIKIFIGFLWAACKLQRHFCIVSLALSNCVHDSHYYHAFTTNFIYEFQIERDKDQTSIYISKKFVIRFRF